MLENMRPEALKALLASPQLHNVALGEQVRRDTIAVRQAEVSRLSRQIRRNLRAEAQVQALLDATQEG